VFFITTLFIQFYGVLVFYSPVTKTRVIASFQARKVYFYKGYSLCLCFYVFFDWILELLRECGMFYYLLRECGMFYYYESVVCFIITRVWYVLLLILFLQNKRSSYINFKLEIDSIVILNTSYCIYKKTACYLVSDMENVSQFLIINACNNYS
jgi:hypothetical protein